MTWKRMFQTSRSCGRRRIAERWDKFIENDRKKTLINLYCDDLFIVMKTIAKNQQKHRSKNKFFSMTHYCRDIYLLTSIVPCDFEVTYQQIIKTNKIKKQKKI